MTRVPPDELEDGILLRPAAPADAAACHALDHRCFPPDIAYDLSVFDQLCGRADIMLVAQMNKKIIGMVAAEIDAEQKIGLIVTLDVDPSRQRRRLGTRLMREVEKKMQMRGVRAVFLHVDARRFVVHGFYQKLGYKRVGQLPAYYGKGKDAFLMSKPLEHIGA